MLKLIAVFAAISACIAAPSDEVKPYRCGQYPPIDFHVGSFFKGDYYQASQYCLNLGMLPVSIKDDCDDEAVAKLLTDSRVTDKKFWTSGTDKGLKGHWLWMPSMEAFTYTNWKNGVPAGRKNCMELKFTKGEWIWNDESCSTKQYVVCEKGRQ